MLFMVIEHFRDLAAVSERFQQCGRMLPDGVEYVDSWMSKDGSSCYQLMSADQAEDLKPWIDAWNDLVAFTIDPVLPSHEYWTSMSISANIAEE